MDNIYNKVQLEEFIWENKNKVSVLYFGAEWCGPCKKLKERLMSEEAKLIMPNLVIGHLDIDSKENQNLCELYKISSIPVQIFISLNGTQIIEKKRIIGYDWVNFTMTYNSIIDEMNKIQETIN
jgi:thiol-disulfide isomerase/thioredoxin